MSLLQVFGNPFNRKNIISLRLLAYAIDHLAKLKKNNPGGVFDTIIAETQALIDSFQVFLNASSLSKSQQKGGTIDKDAALAAFISVAQHYESHVKFVFGKKSGIYAEFYPNGLTEYDDLTTENALITIARFLSTTDLHHTAVGDVMLAAVTSVAEAFTNSREEQVERMGTVSGSRSNIVAGRHPFEIQLCKNIGKLIFTFPGDTVKCLSYCDESKLFAAGADHNQHKTGTVSPGITNIIDSGITQNSTFILHNTGSVMLQFYLADSEDAAPTGGFITVLPGMNNTYPYSAMLSTGTFLNCNNGGPQLGNYDVEMTGI